MDDSSLPFGIDRSLLRLDSQDPYFCLHFIMIFVRDQERSLRFYVDQLGFRLVVDQRFESGGRWIEIAPPDGNASLSLALATPDSEEYKLIGHDTRIYFITEDVNAKFNEWSSRGVRFHFPPQVPEWGGTFTRFEDVDGNSFGLAGFDELTLGVESPKSSNPSGAPRATWKSHGRCKRGSFRKECQRFAPWNMLELVFRRGRWGEITTIFLTSDENDLS